MASKRQIKLENKSRSEEEIASLVAESVGACYGIVGIAKKSSLNEKIIEILNSGSFNEGIFVSKDYKSITVNIYVVVSYGVKITEVLREVQKRVKYVLGKLYPSKLSKVNVYATEIKRV